MKKTEVLTRICQCAIHYSNNLEHKNYLFIYNIAAKNEPHRFDFIETIFAKQNFRHLTGVETELEAVVFYKRCIEKKLRSNDFSVPITGTCEQKLKILYELMAPSKSCKMIGYYGNEGVYLKTSHIIGNVRGVMGFVPYEKNTRFFVPNTVLEGDIRSKTKDRPFRIIAIACKDIKDPTYSNICYLAHEIDESSIRKYIIQHV